MQKGGLQARLFAVLAKLERQIVVGSRSSEVGSGRGLNRFASAVAVLSGSGRCGCLVRGCLVRRSGRSCGCGISSGSGCAHGCAFSVAASEELHVVCYDLGHELLLSLLVIIGAGAYPTLYVNLAAFADKLLCEVCKLPPKNEVVPLRILTKLSVAVPITVCSGKGEGCDFSVLSALGGS